MPGGLKKALRGSQGLWVGLLIVGYLSASPFEIQGPEREKVRIFRWFFWIKFFEQLLTEQADKL
ncbi:hypothetical protein EHC99_23310 [Salmonella enterica subsp. enterica serovar Strathcona]|nr:hypothetical protein [Salmonella enterica]EBZ8637270.1 hypothetical protein [Salmonella enterica subsp. enterica serovar Strathcona]ECH9234997.1 hypothetical protein [Salmonella enterica subsp. enterica]KJP31072.1 hypothetical protein SR70_23930 [Klebsiella aerogenes]EAR2061949.1 hypothetical protein [Salmonella enterica]